MTSPDAGQDISPHAGARQSAAPDAQRELSNEISNELPGERRGVRVRLVVDGELSGPAAQVLRRRLDAVFVPGAAVVVDLREVTYLSSMGVSTLVGGVHGAVACGGSLNIEVARGSAAQRTPEVCQIRRTPV